MINRTFFTITQTILVLICYQSQAFSGVYKWVDDSGQTHYTDQANKKGAEKFSVRENSTTKPGHSISNKASGTTADETGDEIEAGSKTDSKAEPESPLKEPKMVEVEPSKSEKKRFCKEAKNDIASISSRGRLREINDKGEYAYLTEKQRQQRLSAANKKQREFCR